jgi:probable HAF family extracellular repeat protein
VGLGISGAGQARAAVVGLDALGTGSFSTAYSVSGDGMVVSGHVDNQAFRWTAAGVQRVGYLPGGTANSNGYGINGDGSVIVGNSASTASGLNGSEAMRWTAATGMQPLGDLPGGTFFSFARGVSGDGNVVVGRGQNDSGDEAFRWTAAGGMIGLGDISGGPYYSEAEAASHDGSVIVGRSHDNANQIAFRWTAQTGMVPIPSRPDLRPTHAYAITPDASVIVGQAIGPGTAAFRWTASDGLQRLGTGRAIALGVSDDGSVVVGQMYPTTSTYEAGVWDAVHGMRSLSSILAAHNVDLTGWTLDVASDVSADGNTIVGQGTRNGRVVAYRAVIPEPASLGLLALSPLALRRRCR